MLSISKVEKSNEGSYRCIVNNFAGNQTSIPANLTVVEPPRVTTHPQDIKDSITGKPAKLTIQAIGTEPLNYKWQWQPSEKGSGSKEWQPCDVAWSDGATLIIPCVQKFYEGKYRCVASNHAGSQSSKTAQLSVVEPPRITTHPQDVKDAVGGKAVRFTTLATGTEPLKYNWQWKPDEKECGSEEWQPCSAEWCGGTILTIPSVQKLNEGSYRCVISNFVDTQLSEAAKLTVELKVDIQEESAKFTIQTSGTEPLNYHWQWKQTEEGRSEKWQECPSKWSDGATLTVPKVEESKEGSYRCVVSNDAGEQTSIPAKLTIAEPPRITTNPENVNTVQGKNAKFTIHAIGTEPLNYKWEWKPAVDDNASKDWQPCEAKWSNDATLTIPKVDICNEGSYRCVVSNIAGDQTSKPAKLETCLPFQLPLQLRWRSCRDVLYGMSWPNTVVLEENLYMGGGLAGNDSDACTVLVYNIKSDEWSFLPKYRYKRFAMTVINSSLTVVGGRDPSTSKMTNQLAAFSPMSQRWTYPYPPMPTPREQPAVSTYDIWLVVAGGSRDGRPLGTVEVLNTSTKQWLSTSPLPTTYGIVTSTIDEDDWYIITVNKQVLCVSLPDLISQTISKLTDSNSHELWCHLPNTPLSYPATIALHGALLVLGGGYHTPRTDIHFYQLKNEKWIKVGDLPTPRYNCSCILLPSGELLVAGGYDSPGQYTRRVDVAAILD